ncbi:MAG: hypothetical protein ABSA13_12885 [Beijerinckiaceae bacterium]|jgi:hypothetical protein
MVRQRPAAAASVSGNIKIGVFLRWVSLALAIVGVAVLFFPIENCVLIPGAFSSDFSMDLDVSRRACDSNIAQVLRRKIINGIHGLVAAL